MWDEDMADVYANDFGLNNSMNRNRELVVCDYKFEVLIYASGLFHGFKSKSEW
jgi:hypothetical protein